MLLLISDSEVLTDIREPFAKSSVAIRKNMRKSHTLAFIHPLRRKIQIFRKEGNDRERKKCIYSGN